MWTVALAIVLAARAAPPPLEATGTDLDQAATRAEAIGAALGLPVETVPPVGIVGGQLAGERPNVVALAGIDGAGIATVFCSGSVIQETWVLTAAHCLTGASELERYGLVLHVIWGNDIPGDGYTHATPWAEAITYPGYTDAVFANDIGVIELAEPVPDWATLTVVNDVPLDETWIGMPLTFVGFGITNDGGMDSGTMRETSIPIDGYDEQFVYAYTPTSNVCQGDSGGPSFRLIEGREEQVGVNSFVTPGCAGGSNGSTNVVEFLAFLQQHVPDLLLEPAPVGPSGGDGFGAGVADPLAGPGIGMRFGPHDGPGPGEGCNSSGLPAGLVWTLAAAALFGRRRR